LPLWLLSLLVLPSLSHGDLSSYHFLYLICL
jgi:hypothetical protein